MSVTCASRPSAGSPASLPAARRVHHPRAAADPALRVHRAGEAVPPTHGCLLPGVPGRCVTCGAGAGGSSPQCGLSLACSTWHSCSHSKTVCAASRHPPAVTPEQGLCLLSPVLQGPETRGCPLGVGKHCGLRPLWGAGLTWPSFPVPRQDFPPSHSETLRVGERRILEIALSHRFGGRGGPLLSDRGLLCRLIFTPFPGAPALPNTAATLSLEPALSLPFLSLPFHRQGCPVSGDTATPVHGLVTVFRPHLPPWVLPGLIDGDESPEAAALRELEEETGYKGDVAECSPGRCHFPGHWGAA